MKAPRCIAAQQEVETKTEHAQWSIGAVRAGIGERCAPVIMLEYTLPRRMTGDIRVGQYGASASEKVERYAKSENCNTSSTLYYMNVSVCDQEYQLK